MSKCVKHFIINQFLNNLDIGNAEVYNRSYFDSSDDESDDDSHEHSDEDSDYFDWI